MGDKNRQLFYMFYFHQKIAIYLCNNILDFQVLTRYNSIFSEIKGVARKNFQWRGPACKKTNLRGENSYSCCESLRKNIKMDSNTYKKYYIKELYTILEKKILFFSFRLHLNYFLIFFVRVN